MASSPRFPRRPRQVTIHAKAAWSIGSTTGPPARCSGRLQGPAFTALREAIQAGRIHRDYQALVEGNLKESLQIDNPLAHDPRNPRRMIAVAATKDGARAAATLVEPIQRLGDFTLVAARPRTGMRHQIRVHLAEAGLPIAGDTLYGGPPLEALADGRFWLHLAEIEFRSPVSGPVRVRSPLPRDLEQALKQARRRV